MIYPLKFKPILKEKVWGGNKLKTVLNKPSVSDKTGESWEISAVKGSVSIVNNGELSGKSLVEVCDLEKEKLVGQSIYKKFGKQFPLLIKFIDASADLSVQVHPGDEIATKRYGQLGKTEMWYILESDKGAELISGVRKQTNQQEYLQKLAENKITDILNYETANKGDSFFIPAGRIHAIGAGILLAEIQQSSDITYRIHDWDRPGIDGQLRQLHTEQAKAAIDFTLYPNYKTSYKKTLNKTKRVESCAFFTVNFLMFDKPINKDYSDLDSFVIYMCVEGGLLISCKTGDYKLTKGETILLPAAINNYQLIGKASILEIYI